MESIKKFFQKTDHKIILSLFLVSFLTILFFKKPFLFYWDAFTYNLDIIQGHPSGLLLGRTGFIYPHIILWNLLKLFGLSPENYYQITIWTNILLSSISPALLYIFSNNLFKNRSLAITSSLLFLLNFQYLDLSSSGMPEIMMIFFTLISFCLITIGIKEKKTSFIYLGAAAFGYSITIKEQAIVNGLFLATLILLERKSTPKLNKTIITASLTAIAILLIGPLIAYIQNGSSYINQIFNPTLVPIGADNSRQLFSEKIFRLNEILQENIGPISYILAWIGLVILTIKKNWPKLILLITLTTPILLHLFIGYLDPRYFTHFNIGLSILGAITINELIYLISQKTKQKTHKLIIASIIIAAFSILNLSSFYTDLSNKQNSAQSAKNYGEFFLENAELNSVLVMGRLSPMFEFYFKPLKNRENWTNIMSGTSWPKENFTATITNYLSQGRPIYLNPTLLYTQELNDLITSESQINYIEIAPATLKATRK